MTDTVLDTPVDWLGQPLPLDDLTRLWPLGGWREVTRLEGDKNEHFLVGAGDGRFFLRRSYRSKSVTELARQLELMALLFRRGLPVPRIVPTDQGAAYAVVDGRLWVATAALTGAPYDPGRPAHLREVGRGLARYHQTVADLEAGSGEPAPLVELRLRAARATVDPYLQRRVGEVIEELTRLTPDLPRLVIHGGARRDSMLFDGDRLCGVLDFDSAVPDVRVLDLATAAHDFGKIYTARGEGDDRVALDLDRIGALLDAYGDQSGWLTSAEAVALPLLIQCRRLKRVVGQLARLRTEEVLAPGTAHKIALERSRVRWLQEHQDELAQVCAQASRPRRRMQPLTRPEELVDLVVVGLGYVGLPVAAHATGAGMSVVGVDLDTNLVKSLKAGRSHVDDISDDEVSQLLRRGFAPTTDVSEIGRARTVVVCVPTPMGSGGVPDLTAVIRASAAIGSALRPGMLVVLESTTYPGTTEEVVRPILERASGLKVGTDVHLAFSPERIDPGNARFGLRNTPKIVGGATPACTEAARRFYSRFVDTVVVARGTREAEAAKLLENTYRQVNIALVNEMARCFHDLGVDFWEVLRLAGTKPFGFQGFVPGPGVGGSCIPIDPNYLAYRVRSQLGYPLRLVELAQEVNEAMPAYVVRRAQELLNEDGIAVKGSRVLLLGVTYKANIGDPRESPATEVASRLVRMGARVRFHDPHVRDWPVEGVTRAPDGLVAAAADSDLVVLLQAHDLYDLDALAAASARIFDTRGVTSGPNVERL